MAHFAPGVERYFRKRLHDGGIKMGPAASRQLFCCLVKSAGAAIRPVRCNRIHRVGNREYPGAQAYFFAGIPVWIAASIVALVMLRHYLRGPFQEVDSAQDLSA